MREFSLSLPNQNGWIKLCTEPVIFPIYLLTNRFWFIFHLKINNFELCYIITFINTYTSLLDYNIAFLLIHFHIVIFLYLLLSILNHQDLKTKYHIGSVFLMPLIHIFRLPNCSKHIIFMKIKIDIVTFDNNTEFFIPSSIKHLTYCHYRSFVVCVK